MGSIREFLLKLLQPAGPRHLFPARKKLEDTLARLPRDEAARLWAPIGAVLSGDEPAIDRLFPGLPYGVFKQVSDFILIIAEEENAKNGALTKEFQRGISHMQVVVRKLVGDDSDSSPISPTPKSPNIPPSSRYPAPDRSNFSGDLSGGFLTGVLKDNRPYRIESWSEDHNHFVTVFFSTLGIEKASPEELLELVDPILSKPLLVPEKRRRLNKSDVHLFKDARGNELYSLTFVVILGSEDD